MERKAGMNRNRATGTAAKKVSFDPMNAGHSANGIDR
jgi:hypothetical protein